MVIRKYMKWAQNFYCFICSCFFLYWQKYIKVTRMRTIKWPYFVECFAEKYIAIERECEHISIVYIYLYEAFHWFYSQFFNFLSLCLSFSLWAHIKACECVKWKIWKGKTNVKVVVAFKRCLQSRCRLGCLHNTRSLNSERKKRKNSENTVQLTSKVKTTRLKNNLV